MKKLSLTEELAMGTIFTGQISEVHLKNMKIYPFIFLDDVDEVEIAYDIITDVVNNAPGGKSTVSYSLSFKSGNNPSNLKEGHENLTKALSVLFAQPVIVILRDKLGQNLLDNK